MESRAREHPYPALRLKVFCLLDWMAMAFVAGPLKADHGDDDDDDDDDENDVGLNVLV